MKKSVLPTLVSLLLLGLALQAVAVATPSANAAAAVATPASVAATPAASPLEWPLQPFFASTSFSHLICHAPCTSHAQCQTYCQNLGYFWGSCTADLGLECLNNREDTYCSCF